MEQEIGQYYEPLFNFIRKRVRSTVDAEDLTQEVFFKLARAEEQELQNVKSWIYTVARNTVTDHYRTRKPHTLDVDELHISEEGMDSDANRELSACVNPFIEKLPEDYRKLIKLSEIDGMSQKDIAASLDMNYVTVRSKIQRGRNKLRDLITECCHVLQGGRGGIVDFQKKKDCDPDC